MSPRSISLASGAKRIDAPAAKGLDRGPGHVATIGAAGTGGWWWLVMPEASRKQRPLMNATAVAPSIDAPPARSRGSPAPTAPVPRAWPRTGSTAARRRAHRHACRRQRRGRAGEMDVVEAVAATISFIRPPRRTRCQSRAVASESPRRRTRQRHQPRRARVRPRRRRRIVAREVCVAFRSVSLRARSSSRSARRWVIPIIGLAITLVILRITWQSWRTVSTTEPGGMLEPHEH
jgi:hypothetical protein